MEKNLNIKKTILSPQIILNKDTETFIFSGKSGAENPESFYRPVLEWFKNYFKNPNEKTEINFYLEYLNSASSVQIGKLLGIIENNLKKSEISINWIVDEDDELMKETGKEFQYIYKIKFNFIEKKGYSDLSDII